MKKFPWFWLLLLPILGLLGCGTSGDSRGTRVGVRGSVLLDGEPLDRARIVFEAADGNEKVTATANIIKGFYQIPTERGPLVGKMRVRIQPEIIELEEFQAARGGDIKKQVAVETVNIPVEYNTQSELVREIKEDETQNILDFELESKPQK